MCASNCNQHNLILRLQAANAVNNQAIDYIPTHFCFVFNCLKRLFCHARVMLQRERTNRDAIVDISHQTHKTHNRTNASLTCKAHRCWSIGNMTDEICQRYLDDLPVILAVMQKQSAKLAQQPDLATKLVTFCNA